MAQLEVEAEAATMTCVLFVKTGFPGWEKTLMQMFQNIQGLKFSIDAPNMLLYLSGQVDPLAVIKKLKAAKTHAVLYRVDYGYEENPQGARKPDAHFMNCTFRVDTQEDGWYKKIIGALETIQGVSFTIDAASQLGYVSGNIESGVLMKMIAEVHIDVLRIDYGFPPKDADSKQLLTERKSEPECGFKSIVANASQTKPMNPTETKTEPKNPKNRPESPMPSTKNRQSEPKKPLRFGRFLMRRFWSS